MCICINCLYINNCSAYSIVQKQHSTPTFNKLNLYILFTPRAPIINVNIKHNSLVLNIDWDIVECLSFIENPGSWVE